MAVLMKHTARLLSPGESLLRALSSALGQPFMRPVFVHQRRSASNRQKAQQLPQDFNINRLLSLARQPIHIQEAEKLPKHTLDEAIQSRWVQLKDETGKLKTPQLLETVIASLDRTTHSVVLTSMLGPTPDTALVRIERRSELISAQAQKQAKSKATGVKKKQIELNWAISEHDLDLKLRKMEQLLNKGNRVELWLANKKRQRRAETAEAQATLDKVRARVMEIGASERSMDGTVGTQASLTIESRHLNEPANESA